MMAPPSQTLRRFDFDANDAEGQSTQAPQSHGLGLGNNVGKLIQTQLAFSEGDCFPGWDLYFPTTAYEEASASVAAVKDFIKYFQTWSTQYTASVERVLRDKFLEIQFRLEEGPSGSAVYGKERPGRPFGRCANFVRLYISI